MLHAIGLLLFAIAAPPEAAVKAELEKLEGNWKMQSVEVDGVKLPADQVREMRLAFKDGKFTSYMGAQKQIGTIAVDPTKKPKTMDIVPSDGPDKGKTRATIYLLQGNTLKICGSELDKQRPADFETTDKTGVILMILRRE